MLRRFPNLVTTLLLHSSTPTRSCSNPASSIGQSIANLGPICSIQTHHNYCTQGMDSEGPHVKARCPIYPLRRDEKDPREIKRLTVPENMVSWSSSWPDYNPPSFTAPFVLTASWADPELGNPDFSPVWNSLDGKVNRKSHTGDYELDGESGAPLNPWGRTGLSGRGVLGKWGPNHAADPVVTRWKRGDNGEIVKGPDGKQILEFVSIERKDGGGWAIPGGMVDPGESISVTLKREFMEEAMDSTARSESENAANAQVVEKFFESGAVIYKGYVDDPRNTDNSWMETVAVSFHDESGNIVGDMKLKAGDDAKSLRWQEISSTLELYASHKAIIEKAAKMLDAQW